MQQISPIKERIIKYLDLKGISKYKFYQESGITRGVLDKESGISEDNTAKFIAYAKDVNLMWLMTGNGEMLKQNVDAFLTAKNGDKNGDISEPKPNIQKTEGMNLDESHGMTGIEDEKKGAKSITKGYNLERAKEMDPYGNYEPIPLMSQEAAAGFGGANFCIEEHDIQRFYTVPDFKKIDFMVKVNGSSMYPKYNSGDIIAVRVLHEKKFIQWNKTHLIATGEQGMLVKRLKKSDNDGYVVCVSDNKEYDPFEVPVSDITGIALIIGVIRVE